MMKSVSLALALMVGASALVPTVAIAGDTGPCDHCTMEPIVVKGERPKKKKVEAPAQQQHRPAVQFSLMPAPLVK